MVTAERRLRADFCPSAHGGGVGKAAVQVAAALRQQWVLMSDIHGLEPTQYERTLRY